MTIQNITSASALFAGKSCAKKSAQGSAFALPAEVKAESEKKPATTVSCREAYEKERSAINCDKNMVAAENVEEPAVSYTYEDIKDINSENCSFEEFYQLCSYLSENYVGKAGKRVDISDLELIRPEDPRTIDNYCLKLDKTCERLHDRGDVVRANELADTMLFSLMNYGFWCETGVHLTEDYLCRPYTWDLGFHCIDNTIINVDWSDTSTAENPVIAVEVTWCAPRPEGNDDVSIPIKVLSRETYQIAVKDVNPREANLVEMMAYWAYEEARNRDFVPDTGWTRGEDSIYFHLRNSGVEFPNASDAINEKRDWVQFLAQATKEYEKELANESEEYYELWKEYRTTALKRLNDMMERMSQTADEIIDHLAEKEADTAAAVD